MTTCCRYPIIILERITVNNNGPAERDKTAQGSGSGSICKRTSTALNLADENFLSEKMNVGDIDTIKNETSAISPWSIKIEEQVTSSLISSFNEELVKSKAEIKDELLEIVPRVKIKKEFEEEEQTIDNLPHHDLGSLNHSDDIALCEDVGPRRKRIAAKRRNSANSEVFSESGTLFDIVCNGSLSDKTYFERPVKGWKAKLSKPDHCDQLNKIKKLSVVLIDLFPKNSQKLGKTNASEGSVLHQDQSDALKTHEESRKTIKVKQTLNQSQNTQNSNDVLILTDSLYSCPLCPAKFRLKIEFRKHLSAHCDKDEATKNANTEKHLLCTHCLKEFDYIDLFKHHVSYEFCEKFFKCEKCSRRFSKKSTLNKHLKFHSRQKKFCCAHCGKNFEHRSHLRKHITLHLGGKQLSCKHCAGKFLKKGDLEELLESNCKRLRFLGAYSSSEISQEMDHAKNQVPFLCGKKYPCIYCDKNFEQDVDLADHMALAVCTKLFSCKHCSQRFQTKIGLEKHMSCHFGKKRRKFSCKNCGKNFILKRTYEEHLVKGCSNRRSQEIERRSAVPIANKRFSCAHCSSKFTDKGNLQKHMNIHLAIEDRPFSCCLCPKKFTRKEHLQNHLTAHSDLKPFQCSKCPFKFKTKTDCQKHEKIHSGERRFQCKLCPANYKRGSHLSEHVVAVHSDEKPFSCSLCSASFKLKRVLLAHIKRHDDGLKRFTCVAINFTL